MTDNEIIDCLKKTQRRVFDRIDYPGAMRYYSKFLASGEKSYTSYAKEHDEGLFGYKNIGSLVSGTPPVYNNIKKCIGRDFWKEMLEPKLEIVPPEPKQTTMSEFMAQMMLDTASLKKQIGKLIGIMENVLQVEGTIVSKMNQLVDAREK